MGNILGRSIRENVRFACLIHQVNGEEQGKRNISKEACDQDYRRDLTAGGKDCNIGAWWRLATGRVQEIMTLILIRTANRKIKRHYEMVVYGCFHSLSKQWWFSWVVFFCRCRVLSVVVFLCHNFSVCRVFLSLSCFY